MKKAFIFDMDGVIIDSELVHIECKIEIMKRHGVTATFEDMEKFAGCTAVDTFTALAKMYNITDVSVQDLINEKHNLYADIMFDKKLEPIPGIIDLFDRLQAAGYILGIGSSSKTEVINTTVDNLGIRHYFDTIISGTELPRSKPFPDIYLKVAEELGIEPANCTVVEDACKGVQAAKAAGMRCIAYYNPHSGQQDLSLADQIVKRYDEIQI